MQSGRTENHESFSGEGPPVFRTWNQVYAFVLILHALIIIAFYLFTRAYS